MPVDTAPASTNADVDAPSVAAPSSGPSLFKRKADQRVRKAETMAE